MYGSYRSAGSLACAALVSASLQSSPVDKRSVAKRSVDKRSVCVSARPCTASQAAPIGGFLPVFLPSPQRPSVTTRRAGGGGECGLVLGDVGLVAGGLLL